MLALLGDEMLVDDGVAVPLAASGDDALAHQGLRLHLSAAAGAAAATGAVHLARLTGPAPGMPPVNGGRGAGQWGGVLVGGDGGGRGAGGLMQPSRGEAVVLEDHGDEDSGGDELRGPELDATRASSESRWPRNGVSLSLDSSARRLFSRTLSVLLKHKLWTSVLAVRSCACALLYARRRRGAKRSLRP